MDVRPITAVEEVTELADDVQIPVIDNGTLKRISKSNAKFGGGGGLTTFTLVPSNVSTQGSGATHFNGTVLNENGDEVTVEEAIAAWENGLIRFAASEDVTIYEMPSNVVIYPPSIGVQFYFSGIFKTNLNWSDVMFGVTSDK